MAGGGFEGMAELIRDIERLGEGGAAAAERGLLRGAGEMVAMAKGNTPVRTGRARRSIHVGGHPELSGDFNPGADKGWYGDASGYGSPPGKARREVEVGSDLFYFKTLEEGGMIGGQNRQYRDKGGRRRTVKPKWKSGRMMPARRMLGNAVDAVGPKVEGYVAEAVGELASELGF